MNDQGAVNIDNRLFLEHIPHPVMNGRIQSDQNGSLILVDVNKGFEQLTGLSRHQIIGCALGDVLKELQKHEAYWVSQLNQTIETVSSFEERVYLNITGKPYKVNGVVYPEGYLSAIFTENEPDRETGKVTEYLERLDKHGDIPVLIFDLEGTIHNVNQKALELIGNTEGELIGNKLQKISDGINPDTFESFKKNVLEKGKTVWENAIKTPEGEVKYVNFYACLLDVKEGIVHAQIEDITPQKQAEERLKESERKFRLMANNVKDVIWTMDLQLHTTFISPSIFQMTGYTQEEHLQQTLEDRFTSKSAAFARRQFKQDLNKILKGELPPDYTFTGELVYIHKNGGEVWTEVKVSTLRDEHNNIVGIQGLSRDITQRKIAEQELEKYKDHLEDLVKQRTQALKESEFRFRSIVQHVSDIICIIDKDGIIQYESPSLARILGYPENYLTGQSGFDLIHQDDIEDVKNKLDPILEEDEKVVSAYFRALHKNGDWLHLEVIANNMINHSGINGIIVTARDITERIEAEQAIRYSEEKFRNIFNSTSDGMQILDFQGRIIDVNDVTAKRLGLRKQQILGRDLMDFNIKLDKETYKEYWTKLQTQGELMFETGVENYAGEYYDLEISSKIIYYNGQQVILNNTRNITERKALERKIVRTIYDTEEKERNRFAQDLHDTLGAMLSSLKMYLNILQLDKFDDPEKKQEYWKKAFDLLSQSVSSTREIAYNMRPETIDRFGLVPSVNAFVERIQDTTDIRVKFNAEQYNMAVNKNIEIVLYRVISELVNNTLKHASAKNIDISLFNKEEKVFIIYADDGLGFQFNQVDGSKGSGLSNIKSRLNSINAKYEINSQSDTGMHFLVEADVNECE